MSVSKIIFSGEATAPSWGFELQEKKTNKGISR
jgi:hypothetical protein